MLTKDQTELQVLGKETTVKKKEKKKKKEKETPYDFIFVISLSLGVLVSWVVAVAVDAKHLPLVISGETSFGTSFSLSSALVCFAPF